jgi:hypothetical protein
VDGVVGGKSARAPDDLWLRQNELLKHFSEPVGSESDAKAFLLDFFADHFVGNPADWRHETKIGVAGFGVPYPLPEIHDAIDRLFWWGSREQTVQFEVEWDGRSATHKGPLMRLLRNGRLCIGSAVIPGGETVPFYYKDCPVTIWVTFNQFRAAPIIAQLRAKDPLAAAAVETSLAASLKSPLDREPRVMKAWVPWAIRTYPPLRGETPTAYIDRVLMPKRPNEAWTRHSFQTELSQRDWP